jgi:hypothetical protein
VRDPRGEQESGLPPELPDDPVRLALYVFGLRDRPVRNTRITSEDADKLATAISTFRYDVSAGSRGDADFKEIACRLDHLESENAGILERLETRARAGGTGSTC